MQLRTDAAYIASLKKLSENMSNAKKLTDKLDAEKACLIFYRDNAAETEPEQNNFNTQLLLLEGARQFVRLAANVLDYRKLIKMSGAKVGKDFQPDDSFIQALRDMQVSLNKNKVAPTASDTEAELLELRRRNLKSCLRDYRNLQKRALTPSSAKTAAPRA